MDQAFALKILMIAYAFFNGARVLSYVPQIIAASKDRTGAKAISLLTWGFWTMANLTTALYATYIVDDVLLMLMNIGNTFGCAVVFAIVWCKRLKYNKDHKLVGDLTQEFSTLTNQFTVGDNGMEQTQVMSHTDLNKDENKSASALFTDK